MKELNKLVASLAVFNMKLNNIHFNYKGEAYLSMHKLTEELYELGLELYDDMAEKVRMQDVPVPASFKDYLELSYITEMESKSHSLKEVIDIIVKDLTTIIDNTKEIEGSPTVQPQLDEVLMTADKYRWLFKSFI